MRPLTAITGLALALVVTALGVGAGRSAAMLPPEEPAPFHLKTSITPKPVTLYKPTPVGLTIAGRLGPIGSGIQPGTKELSIKIDATRLDLAEVPHCLGRFTARGAPHCVEVAHGSMRVAYRFGFKDPGVPGHAAERFAIYLLATGPDTAHLVGRISLPGWSPVATFPVTATDEYLPKALRLTAELPYEPWSGATIESFRLTVPKTLPGRDGPTEPLESFCPEGHSIRIDARAKTYSTVPTLKGEAFESCG
jgi:hypothetical protein